MLDLLALGEIDGILTDVRREVGDAFEVPADEQELNRRSKEWRYEIDKRRVWFEEEAP